MAILIHLLATCATNALPLQAGCMSWAENFIQKSVVAKDQVTQSLTPFISHALYQVLILHQR